MDEYILHKEYYKSIGGEDGEEPLAVHGSRPRTDLGSYAHSGPPSDRAETASLPRRPRPEYPCCPTRRAPEVGPTRVEEQHHPRPTYGALDHTAELLAKLLSGSEDPDLTALSEAIKAKLGIAEPLPKQELPSLSPGLSTLAEDLKRSRVSRLLPKVTCPSPFHPRARTVPMADLQDVPVTESERRGLSALAPLAGVSPSGLTPGGGKTGRPIAEANIQLELPEFDPKNLPEWAEEFAEFLLLTIPLLPTLSSGRMTWTACPLHCAAASPFVATGNIAFVSSRVIHSPLQYLARRMAPTAHFSCSTSPASRIHSSATLARAVRKSHCHVFLGVLDPGQAPLKTLC